MSTVESLLQDQLRSPTVVRLAQIHILLVEHLARNTGMSIERTRKNVRGKITALGIRMEVFESEDKPRFNRENFKAVLAYFQNSRIQTLDARIEVMTQIFGAPYKNKITEWLAL